MPDIFRRNMDVALLQRDADKFPFIFDCEEPGCYWHTAHGTWAQAANTRLNHRAATCPLDGRAKIGRHGNPVGASLIEQMWGFLDETTKFLIEAPDDVKQSEEFRVARGQAQGVAKCIWLFSQPHFEAPKNVASWAVRRYRMEHKGLEFEPTPGCKGYNPNPPSVIAQQPLDPAKRPAARRTPAPAAPSGDEELAKMDPGKKTLAGNAIKAGFADAKVLGLVKMSPAALAALKAEVAAQK